MIDWVVLLKALFLIGLFAFGLWCLVRLTETFLDND